MVGDEGVAILGSHCHTSGEGGLRKDHRKGPRWAVSDDPKDVVVHNGDIGHIAWDDSQRVSDIDRVALSVRDERNSKGRQEGGLDEPNTADNRGARGHSCATPKARAQSAVVRCRVAPLGGVAIKAREGLWRNSSGHGGIVPT
jgi:hypothetical protein